MLIKDSRNATHLLVADAIIVIVSDARHRSMMSKPPSGTCVATRRPVHRQVASLVKPPCMPYGEFEIDTEFVAYYEIMNVCWTPGLLVMVPQRGGLVMMFCGDHLL